MSDNFNDWYSSTKNNLTILPEWQSLANNILRQIEFTSGLLVHNHPFYCSSAEHKFEMIDKLIQSPQCREEYLHLKLAISQSLEASLNSLNTLGYRSQQENLVTVTKVCESILNCCDSRNLSLYRNHFRQLYFEKEISSHIRYLVWKTCLKSPKHQDNKLDILCEILSKKYCNVQIQANMHSKLTSKINSLIESSFPQLIHIPEPALKLIFDCLVIYSVHIFPNTTICSEHLKLIYPCVLTVLNYSNLQQQPDTLMFSERNIITISHLLALYLSLMNVRSYLIRFENSPHSREHTINNFALEVCNIVKRSDHTLFYALCALTSNSQPQLITVLSQLLRENLDVMFVGTFQPQLVHYIWDQYLLNLHSSEIRYLTFFCASWLLACKRWLIAPTVRNWIDAKNILSTHSPTLTITSVRNTLSNREWCKLHSDRTISSPTLSIRADSIATTINSNIPCIVNNDNNQILTENNNVVLSNVESLASQRNVSSQTINNIEIIHNSDVIPNDIDNLAAQETLTTNNTGIKHISDVIPNDIDNLAEQETATTNNTGIIHISDVIPNDIDNLAAQETATTNNTSIIQPILPNRVEEDILPASSSIGSTVFETETNQQNITYPNLEETVSNNSTDILESEIQQNIVDNEDKKKTREFWFEIINRFETGIFDIIHN